MLASPAVADVRKLLHGWRWRAGYLMGTRVPVDFDDELRATILRVRRHTLSSAERIAALCDAVSHLERQAIPGALVECGVWKGGSMMAAALTLESQERDLYLFDTFSGMAEPTEADVPSPYDGYSPHRKWQRKSDGWAAVPTEAVRAAMDSTGYPGGRVHLIAGKVEDTLPGEAPAQIALLRLDTDWYESTKHELETLYPRLVPGGVLIVDDYGHYEGARRAVDEYFAALDRPPLLTRIDYTGRIAVKR